ncbi:hypothetical protein BU17DRAFT_23360, partial [Hysterangium stoloniferum]
IQGVRRWIGANPASSSRKSKVLATTADEELKEIPEPKPADPQSSEAVVARLLSLTVSDEEEQEYQLYIEQCQSLLSSSGSGAQRRDLDIYWASVRAAAGEM